MKLMYITNNPKIATVADNAGVDRIFIDMEYIGKELRQGGMDTVQNHHTVEDIKNIRKVLKRAELLVRINPIHDKTDEYSSTEEEIDEVIKAGADIIMLPFFKTASEAERFLKAVDGRCRAMLLFETKASVDNMDEILKLPNIDEVFIGLNDLSLEYGYKFMFEPLANGMVETMTQKFKNAGIPFGFGGIASIGNGTLKSEKILAEHIHLGSDCVILSRSFCNISSDMDIGAVEELFTDGVDRIRRYENSYSSRDEDFFRINLSEIKSIVDEISK